MVHTSPADVAALTAAVDVMVCEAKLTEASREDSIGDIINASATNDGIPRPLLLRHLMLSSMNYSLPIC